MNLLDVIVLTMALGLVLAIARFALLAFLPAHPMSQFLMRLDRFIGALR